MIQPVTGDILVRSYRPGDDIPAGWTLSALGRPGEDGIPVLYRVLTAVPAVTFDDAPPADVSTAPRD